MKMESAPSAQSISEESITCVAVKEDRHQNIMSSVASKKGVEEPWTIERVVKFIDLVGYREITLKSDTESDIIALRNRVAAMCKVEVTTEDAVKGDKESNGLIETTVMPLRGIFRTIKCHIESRKQDPLSDDSPVKTLVSSEQRLDAQVAMQSKTTREHRHTQIAAERESKNASELLRMEQKGWIDETR